MKPNPVILFISILLTCTFKTSGQAPRKAKLSIDAAMVDTFAFTNQWDYPWYIIKKEDGTFSNTLGEKITEADTTHLFFTSNCQTNVQGGYTVNYCYASTKSNTVTLHFTGGLPAYGGDFYVYIKGDSFYFKPTVAYPVTAYGEKSIFITNNQKLQLNKNSYTIGDTITGYINCSFTQLTTIPNKRRQKQALYLKGYFCTVLKSREEKHK